ncbi:MAG TPA: ATP-dependent helicase, partial [Planctomycetota bacterium]|nr:ATP-dependent helicase [Planctomycetota bacterium]
MRQHGTPYQIVGGLSFFQRREVKDLVAYLRLAANPNDTVSFWRVWNLPRRGLGPGVRAQVEGMMLAQGVNPPDALRAVAASGALNRPARAGAESFLALLAELRERGQDPAGALLSTILERTGYRSLFDDEERREKEERLQAIEELVAAAADVDLETFLAEAALVTDADRLEEGADRLLMLTMHNAKGLEFPVVVVAGLEEGMLPHAGSLDDDKRLEEERRLFYVAITRAREEVLLTAAAYRRRWDGAQGGRISRFVDEIPEEVLEREQSAGAWRSPSSAGAGWRRGGGGDRGGGHGHAREDWHDGAYAEPFVDEVPDRRYGRSVPPSRPAAAHRDPDEGARASLRHRAVG